MAIKNLRPGSNDYLEAKRETLEILGIQMEMDLIYGVRTTETDSTNNQPKQRSMGIRQFISTYGPAANLASYKYDANYSGQSWIQGGFDWLMNKAKDLALYCDLNTTWHVVGAGTKLGLAQLAERRATIQLKPTEVEYGVNVTKLTTPFGEFNLIDHPLFNKEPALQYAWIGIPRDALTYHTVSDPDYGNSDVRFLADENYGKGGATHIDGRLDLWMVEYGYEFAKSKEWFWLNDVGRACAA